MKAVHRISLLVLATSLSIQPAPAASQSIPEHTVCQKGSYALGFFNGVWNSSDDAGKALERLGELIGTSYNGEPMEPTLFYNTTGKEAGSNDFQDLAETFIQTAHQLDESGELEKRFEYLWEAIHGQHTLWDRVTGVFQGAALALEGIYRVITSKTLAALSRLFYDPPTEEDYRRHQAQVDTLALEGRKMLFIAHSQGNFFVNKAWSYTKSRYPESSVATLHIAPATAETHGEHLLAYIDVVIKGLRLLYGPTAVPSNNILMAPSGSDASGHMLWETYLDAGRKARGLVKERSLSALASLKDTTPTASPGLFTTTLTWDGEGDVDLHTREPNGQHVYYLNSKGLVGELDVDNRIANGPEHYYASCDTSVLQEGIYRIGVNNFKGPEHKATVQISFAQGGQPITRVIDTGAQRGRLGDDDEIPVAQIRVRREANGAWKAEMVKEDAPLQPQVSQKVVDPGWLIKP